MRKQTIVITAFVMLVFAITALLCSCADNEIGSGMNGDVGIDADGDIGEETESPDTSGGEDVEEVTNNRNATVTMQEIEEMKDHLEKLLIDNYDIFNQIVNYFEVAPVEYRCGAVDGEMLIAYYTGYPNNQPHYVDISEIEVAEEIAYVINELGFLGINDYGDCVWFEMVYNERHPTGGYYDQSLIYYMRYSDEYGVIDAWEANDPLFGGFIRIRDEWCYYGTEYGGECLID